MRSHNLAYKFLQSFLVILVFLLVLSSNSISFANPVSTPFTLVETPNGSGQYNLNVTVVPIAGTPTLTLEYRSGPTWITAPGTLSAAPYTWNLTNLNAGVYNFRVTDTVTTTSIVDSNRQVGPIMSNTGFTITPSQPIITSGDVDVLASFSSGAENIDALRLYVQVNSTGPYVQVGPAIGSTNSNIWLAASNIELQGLPDGNHRFRVEGDSVHSVSGEDYIYYREVSFTVDAIGGISDPVPVADAFDWNITENNGDLTIITSQKDATYTLTDVKLIMTRPDSSIVDVGSLSAPTPIGPVLTWDHPTYTLLAALPGGLYNFKLEGTAFDSGTGIYSFLSDDIDFEVIGNILTLTANEPTFGNLGVTATNVDPVTTPITSMDLYIKLTSEPDSAYQLVRTETPGSVTDPFLWGEDNPILDPAVDDILLRELEPDSYTLKVEATITDPNNAPATMVISKELDYVVLGTPIEFKYVEDNGDIGIEIIANHPQPDQEVQSIKLEFRRLPGMTWTEVRLDESGRSGTANPYLFGIINPAQVDNELVNMCPTLPVPCQFEARVTATYLDERDTADIIIDPIHEIIELHPFEVTGASLPPGYVSYLASLLAKEFKFRLEFTNQGTYDLSSTNADLDISTQNNDNILGVQLIASSKVNLADISRVELKILDGMTTTTVGTALNGAAAQNTANWVWGSKTCPLSMCQPILASLSHQLYTLQAEITLSGKIINKVETVRPADDVQLKCVEVYDYVTGQWDCPAPAPYTDDKILGDKIGDPNDLNIPVP